MNLSGLNTDDLTRYVEDIALEQARRRNGVKIHSDNDDVAGMDDGALKIEADEARRELNRRNAKPVYRATFN